MALVLAEDPRVTWRREAAADPDGWAGRPAPPMVVTGSRGRWQLSPRFSEWMMGLPDGWVTDVPGVDRFASLTMLGNGQVPQAAAAALRAMLTAGGPR